jgi:hypothetical protein
MDGAFHDADGKPGFNFADRGSPHGWKGSGSPHGAVFSHLRLIAGSERIVGNAEVILEPFGASSRSRNGLRGNQRMISAKPTSGPE